jgi:hypothetical protein
VSGRPRSVEATLVEELPGLRGESLLRHPDQGIFENNLGRAGIWWLSSPEQLPIWERLELGGGRAVVSMDARYAHLGPPTAREMCVLAVLMTMWGGLTPTYRAENLVHYSMRGLHTGLGNTGAPSSEQLESLRCSLERLTYVSVERDWYDAKTGETTRQVRRIIADADFIGRGRPGEVGRAQRGFVRFAPTLHEQLLRRHFAYALDLRLLNELPSPLAKRIYVLVSTDRMFRDPSAPRRANRISYALTDAFYSTIGMDDTNPQRRRLKVAAAAREIREREPNFITFDVATGRRPRLEVVRLEGASRAPERRSKRDQPARPPAPLVGPLADEGSASPPIDERAHEAYERAASDPRVRALFGRYLAESMKGPLHELAWREHRRDLIAWLVAGEQGDPPEEPRLDPA